MMTASVMKELNGFLVFNDSSVKRCVRYVFASLFCKSKGKHLWNRKMVFISLRKFFSFFNQILSFPIFKCQDSPSSGTKYSRMYQIKFVEDTFENFFPWSILKYFVSSDLISCIPETEKSWLVFYRISFLVFFCHLSEDSVIIQIP